jgi:hypothetical protein
MTSLVFLHVASCVIKVSGVRGYVMKLRFGGPTVAFITIHQHQWLGDIAGTQVARNIILQGGPVIQTAISLKGLRVSIRRIAK